MAEEGISRVTLKRSIEKIGLSNEQKKRGISPPNLLNLRSKASRESQLQEEDCADQLPLYSSA